MGCRKYVNHSCHRVDTIRSPLNKLYKEDEVLCSLKRNDILQTRNPFLQTMPIEAGHWILLVFPQCLLYSFTVLKETARNGRKIHQFGPLTIERNEEIAIEGVHPTKKQSLGTLLNHLNDPAMALL